MAIYAKLLEFQKKGITLKKDGTNPHFKSSYVTLNEVLEKVKKPLNDAKILIVQRGSSIWESGKGYVESGLTTELIDTEDGTLVSSFIPFVGTTDMQKLGGAITYARRYALISMLGLEDEDDDGTTAVKPILGGKKGVIEQDEQAFTGNDFKL